jgi:hypothetical protein
VDQNFDDALVGIQIMSNPNVCNSILTSRKGRFLSQRADEFV